MDTLVSFVAWWKLILGKSNICNLIQIHRCGSYEFLGSMQLNYCKLKTHVDENEEKKNKVVKDFVYIIYDEKLSKILSLLCYCNVFIWCKCDGGGNCDSQQWNNKIIMTLLWDLLVLYFFGIILSKLQCKLYNGTEDVELEF